MAERKYDIIQMNKPTKILQMIIFSISVVHAQNQITLPMLSGSVMSFDSGEPLAGANILVMNTNYGAAANLKGKFEIKLPVGTYSLKISMIGYENLVIDNVVIAENEIVVIDTSLKQKA